MSHPSLTPEQVASLVAMRSAGYTLATIAEALGASVSTVQRHIKSSGTLKGSTKAAVVEAAKQHLLERITSDDALRMEVAKSIADDLAHAALIRMRVAIAAEHLTASNLAEAALVMRAAAAYSTVVKNTSDMLRHAMRADRVLDAETEATLPELCIRELTDEEVLVARQRERAEDGSLLTTS